MFKYVPKSGENKIKQYFLILYQGLKPKLFFWEFINSLRKVLILVSFMLPGNMKAVASIFVLIISTRLQLFLKPYKVESNNNVEIAAMEAGMITLICGLIFNQDNRIDGLDFIIFLVITIINTKFVLIWLYLYTQSMGEKYKVCRQVSTLLRKLMCFKHKSDKVAILKKRSQKLKYLTKLDSDKEKKKPKAYRKLLPKHGKLKKNKTKVESLTKQIVKMDMMRDENPSRVFKEKDKLRRNATRDPYSFKHEQPEIKEDKKDSSESEESIDYPQSMHISVSSQ